MRYLQECPIWTERAEDLDWINTILNTYSPVSCTAICSLCLLPQPSTSTTHAECDIWVDHAHPGADKPQTNLNIFGPALLLIQQQPIRDVMGLVAPTESITALQVAQFLTSTSRHPPIQVLLLLYYHLRHTTAHSPTVPAASITLAAGPVHVPLPPRDINNRFLLLMQKATVDAAVRAANLLDSVRPVSGFICEKETYRDGTSAQVTVEWSRSEPGTVVHERIILRAQSEFVIQALDRMSDLDARLMIRVISRERRGNGWQCPCGSGSMFRVCTHLSLVPCAVK
jgi:hypothetical protein